jgi:integrase
MVAGLDVQVEDKALKKLVQDIPDIRKCSRSDNTNVQYMAAFKRWKALAAAYEEINVLPAKPKYVLLYLTHLAKEGVSTSVINLAVSAIAWPHTTKGLVSPTEDKLLKEAIAGLRRKCCKVKIAKEPLSLVNLEQIIRSTDLANLIQLCNVTMLFLAFFAFLRFDELVAIRTDDIWYKDYIALTIRKSKTDQLRQGNDVLVAKVDSIACPVSLLINLYKLGKIKDASIWFFRRIFHNKGKLILSPMDQPLKYSNVLDIFRQKFTEIGRDAKDYGTHSLRAGGSTEAANLGVDERIFQRHGRWKSVSAKNGYIKDSIAKQLEVTKAFAK